MVPMSSDSFPRIVGQTDTVEVPSAMSRAGGPIAKW